MAASANSGSSATAATAELHVQSMQKSFLVSADMAHALHPNYPEKHDPALQPCLGGGMVIKSNVEQRYATNAASAFFFRAAGAQAAAAAAAASARPREGGIERRGGGLPVQEFAVPADCGCGSTIGPILAAATGIRTVDVGCAQWSMHSIRETMGSADVAYAVAHFRSVYENFVAIDATLAGDAASFLGGVSMVPTCGEVGGGAGGEGGSDTVGAAAAERVLFPPRPVARSMF